MNLFAILFEYYPRLIDGSLLTLKLTFSAFFIATFIVLPLAIVRTRVSPYLQFPLRVYISFMRGTPLIAQLFLVYYGSAQFREALQAVGIWDFFSEPYTCALFTFTLNTIAYQTEIIRGGLQTVSNKEIEAGKAIGMSPLVLYRRIIIPHAYRIGFPALGNEAIILLKASAIVGVVTIYDLLGTTREIFARTFDFSVYIWAAITYIIMTSVFVYLWRYAEIRLSPHIFAKKKKMILGGNL